MAATTSTQKFRIEKNDFQKQRIEFVEKMQNVSKFLDHALVENLLKKEQYNTILAENTSEKKIRKIMDFIEKKLPSKSEIFIKVLLKSENDYLVKKLLRGPQTDTNEVRKDLRLEPAPQPHPEIANFTEKYPIEDFTRHRINFLNYMSDMPSFIDFALSVNLLNSQNKEEILCVDNVYEQIRKLCDMMEKRLPEKSDKFLFALTKSGNDYLVDLMKSEGECDFTDLERINNISRTTEEEGEETSSTSIEHCYSMNRRGRVVIIDNIEFDKSEYNRLGSERDREKIIDFFSKLEFEIKLKPNLSAEQMRVELHEEIFDEKGYNEDCFILFIMSHGKVSEIYGTDLKTISYSEIFKMFEDSPVWNNGKEQELETGKPKLIYIQACQTNVSSDEEAVEVEGSASSKVSSHISPGGHFYIMYATIPGNYALRHTVLGSRFIQNIIQVYSEKYLHVDVETMGIEIKQKVYKISISDNLQIAVAHSCLPKKVFLRL